MDASKIPPEQLKVQLDKIAGVLISNAEILPPEARRREIPYLAMALVMGAHVFENHKGRDGVYGIMVGKEYRNVSSEDMAIIREIAAQIELLFQKVKFASPESVLDAYHKASLLYERMTDSRAGKRGIFMLKDEGGCGYWRMMLPARYIDTSDCFIDISSAVTKFEFLLEYQTICVQRIHDWDSYYILEKLKRAGKHIVYDIDDDIFSLEESNPVAKFMGRDEQISARACMALADVITTSTAYLQMKLQQITKKEVILIPNALDTTTGWQNIDAIGSPDSIQRIFWQGSSSHEEDWTECWDAVAEVMAERPSVRLVILGHLPRLVREAHASTLRGRVEFSGFRQPETYFEMVKHIRAEVGLAPVKKCEFNNSKSSIKWLEYSLIGIPTVASSCLPYSDVIQNDTNGFLCSGKKEWKEAILCLLDNKGIRRKFVQESRKLASEQFDVHETAKEWKSVLIP